MALVHEDDEAVVADLFVRFTDALDRRDVAACRGLGAAPGPRQRAGVITKHLLGRPVVHVIGDHASLAVDANVIEVGRDNVAVVVTRVHAQMRRAQQGWLIDDVIVETVRRDVHGAA